MESTIVTDMDTKIETTNTGGKVLAYDGEGMGVGSLLVSAVNDYAVSKELKVKPVCSFASVWYERHPQFGDILNSAI